VSEKKLRGSTLGRISFEAEFGVELAPRKNAEYETGSGERFSVVFDAAAELPYEWVSPHTGALGRLLTERGNKVVGIDPNAPAPTPPTVTHWEQLMKRRTVEELEALLADRIAQMREKRGDISHMKKSA
jgi:hypothetical protein